MTDRSKLDAFIAELEAAAYQRGRDDAQAEFQARLKAVSEQLSKVIGEDVVKRGRELQEERNRIVHDLTEAREPREGSDQAKVLEKIREHPGLRGVEVVKALDGKVEERTVRTALHRLRLRNAIIQKEGKWHPVSMALFQK